MLTAGGNLDWFRTQVVSEQLSVSSAQLPISDSASDGHYQWINEQVAMIPAGSRGLIYLPYLAGERSPFSDPQARGAFIGLSTTSTQAHMARAVMEGVALAYRSLCEALNLASGGPLYLVGGGAKSSIWSQILADVLGCEVQVVAAPGDAAARGAAILAGVSLGWWPHYAPGPEFYPVAQVFKPDERHRPLYDALYAIFQGIYPRLRGAFADLAALRSLA